jgi:transposase
MDRYVGLDVHAETCTLAVIGPSGRRLTSRVVETNGRALVDAVRAIPGQLHLCMEEGTQSAWLYKILEPHVAEIAVIVPKETRGAKDDLRDAWARAEELRTGAISTRVYKPRKHMAMLRCAARAYRLANQDLVPTKNRLKAVFRSRGIVVDAGVYDARARGEWLKKLVPAHRQLAECLGREIGRPATAEGRGRGVVAAGSENASDHTQAEDSAGHGTRADGAARGHRRDTRSLPEPAAVLELLRAGCRHAFVLGLEAWTGRTLGPWRGAPDARTDKEAASDPESGVQGGRAHGTQMSDQPLRQDYERMLQQGTKPNLARLTIARRIAAIVLSMWKHKEVYDPKRHKASATTYRAPS